MLMPLALFALFSCGFEGSNSLDENVLESYSSDSICFPRYYYWNDMTDSAEWVPFRFLPYRGMKLDSIKCLLGEPDFVSGCKMAYGLDKYGSQGCDIAPIFKNDSCAIVYECTWQSAKNRVQTVLFFEYTHTYAEVDTPIWGFKVDLDKVMLE